jgi:hypothetical protein
MVKIQYLWECDRCNREITANIGQSIIDSKLVWYLSYRCKSCNYAIELDDFGFLPTEIRQKVIQKESEWKLKVDSVESKSKVKIIKILRRALNLSIKDTSKLAKNFPHMTRGTKVEMQWLQKLLVNENIQSSIEKK